jgi:hypothetical protein
MGACTHISMVKNDERCKKIQQEKGILIVETETIQGNL